MQTQAITASFLPPAATLAVAVDPSVDQFCVIAAQSGVIATEFSRTKEEEIYGEDEPSEYVYQVIRGAVRAYKLLDDGRRQIGAFHLKGDVFDWNPARPTV